MSKNSIMLERFGNKGWSWYWGKTAYRTNEQGDGLWIMREGNYYGNGTSQIIGTCEFELPQNETTARRKIYRLKSKFVEPEIILSLETEAELKREWMAAIRQRAEGE